MLSNPRDDLFQIFEQIECLLIMQTQGIYITSNSVQVNSYGESGI